MTSGDDKNDNGEVVEREEDEKCKDLDEEEKLTRLTEDRKEYLNANILSFEDSVGSSKRGHFISSYIDAEFLKTKNGPETKILH